MEALAKPSGISLEDHTRHVREEAVAILQTWQNLSKKYYRMTGQDLEKLLLEAVHWHDQGKKHPQWQNACKADFDIYVKWLEGRGLVCDPENIGQYKSYQRHNPGAGSNLKVSGLRHEFASLQVAEEAMPTMSEVVKTAIAAHHSKLGFRFKQRWKHDGSKELEDGPFFKFWVDFRKLFRKNKRLPIDKIVSTRYEYTAVRVLLQLADTRASRAEGDGKDEVPFLRKFEFEDKFKGSYRPVQEAALRIAESGEDVAILRAPTGSGKTYAALLWANEHIKNGKADRLIVAMPTRFTSNALAIGIAENLGETGLYHSSAWFNRYGDIEDKREKSFAKEQHKLAQILATPTTVCTIDHLMICLTGTKEAHHASFFFLANSAVVFDEADFYDPFVQANITVLLDVLRTLEVPVLIMSATVPNSARDLYGVSMSIQEASGKLGSDPEPSRSMAWAGSTENPEDVEEVLNKMLSTQTGIIYCNTVKRAIAFYEWIQSRADDIQVMIYHSRFTEPDKKKKEEQLLDALGKEAWMKRKDAKGIAILTQIGEMSVNISAPIMLSDTCPWDRLAQRLGRLNRFGESTEGLLYVMEPIQKGVSYPAPYGELENRKWTASEPFSQSLEEMRSWLGSRDSQKITSEMLVERVNGIYPKPPPCEGSIKSNQRRYKDMIQDNWLIVPDTSIDEEKGKASDWRSRQIPDEVDVFIQDPGGFKGFGDYLEKKLEYTVSVPVWAINSAANKDQKIIQRLIRKMHFRDEKEEDFPIFLTSMYNSETGLMAIYGMADKGKSGNYEQRSL